MKEFVECKTIGYKMCPWCRKPTVSTKLEIWFGRFRHVEKECSVCGYYRYT
ncbi:MAG: hypothetical protein QMD21_06265 [Candidatus Thermoplasmatota archaeon]|nr:hypothetical protein [Candidatus Thermoplasmatota archaeon]MDI6856368.1 hypothetical protein [Candidatus Thermoplasmatota archaeon]